MWQVSRHSLVPTGPRGGVGRQAYQRVYWGFCCCDKMPGINNLRKEGLISICSSRELSSQSLAVLSLDHDESERDDSGTVQPTKGGKQRGRERERQRPRETEKERDLGYDTTLKNMPHVLVVELSQMVPPAGKQTFGA